MATVFVRIGPAKLVERGRTAAELTQRFTMPPNKHRCRESDRYRVCFRSTQIDRPETNPPALATTIHVAQRLAHGRSNFVRHLNGRPQARIRPTLGALWGRYGVPCAGATRDRSMPSRQLAGGAYFLTKAQPTASPLPLPMNRRSRHR